MNKDIKLKLEAFENQIRTKYINTDLEKMEDLYLSHPFFMTNYDSLVLEQIYEMDSTYKEDTNYWNEIGQY